MRRHTTHLLLALFAVIAVCAASFLLADYVQDSQAAQELVDQFGYAGIFAIAVLTGLNTFVPIPTATFTPVFLSAGFPLWTIIVTFVLGTVLADAIGYLIGVGGRHVSELRYPTFQKRLARVARDHHRLILPGVFLLAAFAPMPNEIFIIPLAIAGVRFKKLLLPLLLGTIVHQTLFAFGFAELFRYLF